jgi:uncharacterized membrane-anchored protein YhcB (DUF1043 family)
MGVPELIGIGGFMLTMGTLIGKVSSSTSAKQAGLEQRVESLEKSFEVFQTGIHKHMDRQDEKLDRILENWYQMNSSLINRKGE